MAPVSRAVPASASRCFRITARRSTTCISRRTWPCTKPSAPAATSGAGLALRPPASILRRMLSACCDRPLARHSAAALQVRCVAEKSEQTDQDQVDCDDLVEQAWDDENENAGDQGDYRAHGNGNRHGSGLIVQ